MTEVKICPQCGSLMVLRTAKKGKNAGGKFYGCSRYPKCKATIPVEPVYANPFEPVHTNSFEPVYTNSIEHKNEKQSPIETSFPRPLIASSRFQKYQVQFYETVAVPEDLLEMIVSEDVEEKILKAFSQWRIDFPEKKYTPTDKQRQIISVLAKILTRGRITLPSPQIEKKFKEIFESPKIESPLSLIESLVIRGYKKAQKSLRWLDSKEGNILYQDILPQLLGENYEQFVLPQVNITSLIFPSLRKDTTEPQNIDITKYQKKIVDFAIFHPRLEEKIIVEIDDEQDKGQIESDKERDKILQEHGYSVIRIQPKEIQKGNYYQLPDLESKLSVIKQWSHKSLVSTNQESIKFILSIKIAHQIQITLLQAIQSGFLDFVDTGSWRIVADLDELNLFDKNESLKILRESVTDFVELLRKLNNLYSIRIGTNEPRCILLSDYTLSESANTIYISFIDKFTTNLPTFYVQNIYFPFHITNTSFKVSTPLIEGFEKPEEKDLEYFLQYLFRKPHFWEGQYDGIIRVLQGKDAFLLLPTGSGKSMVYQLASLLLPGMTVIIDPIISLMDDQIYNLAMIGIDRCIAITSQIKDSKDKSRAIELLGQGEYFFVFVAPERFQIIEFRESLGTLTVHTPISLIVIDEAHCVSEWGHDFRTSYLNIGRISREYCKTNNYVPPLLAMTGTASRAVLKDVQRELQIEDFEAIITPKSFDRKELKFDIIYSNSQEKIARLKGYIGQKLPALLNTTTSTFCQTRGKETYSGLVFCPHVNGDFGVERVADEIRKNLGISADIYSGKEPKDWDDPNQYLEHKQRVTKEFKLNRIPLLVCTKAFGMGIDKPNIRYTIHFGIPPSVESFYQEAGRAGRDRKTAYCCIILSNDEPKRAEKLLNPNTKVEEIDEILKKTPREENDDITRVLYFHVNSFRGIAKEKQDVEEVLRHIGDVSKKGKKTISVPDRIKQNDNESKQPREIVEKALHRLLLIGVISDYTINYFLDKFTITLSGANKEEILETYGNYVANYQYSRKQTEMEKASRLLDLDYYEFIIEMVNLLLHFIYNIIERGRRDRFYQMLLLCKGSPSDEVFRQRLLTILQETEYSKVLEEIINDKEVDFIKVKDLFDKMVSTKQFAELKGEVSRYLGDYPDHPSLLMLRSLSQIFSDDKNFEVTKQYFIASISSARTNYGLSDDIVFDFAIWAVSNIAERDKKLARELIFELTKSSNRILTRTIVEKLPIELTDIPAWFLLEKLIEDCNTLIFKIGD